MRMNVTSMSSRACVAPFSSLGFFWPTGLGLLAVLAWDSSGGDLALARLMGDSRGFYLAGNPVLTVFLHTGARYLSWLAAALVMAAVVKPWGLFKAFPRADLFWAASTTLLCALLVSLVKHASLTSCPWDLALFGGTVPYVSHWQWSGDGGPGGCFPAGHASSAFAFLPFYFLVAQASPPNVRRARACLAGVLVAGSILGLAQQLRGAHFMSHTLWTAWLCWTLAGGSWLLRERYRRRRPDRAAVRSRAGA